MTKSKLNYTGKVLIKVKNRPVKKRHNEGTPHLFDLIHNILTNALPFEDASLFIEKLPAYFTFVSNADNSITKSILMRGKFSDIEEKTILLQSLPIVSRDLVEEDNSSSIRLSALLTNSMINTSKNLTSKGYILMLNHSQEKILAFSSVDLTELQPVYEDISGQAAIEWLMSFGNNEEE